MTDFIVVQVRIPVRPEDMTPENAAATAHLIARRGFTLDPQPYEDGKLAAAACEAWLEEKP